MLVTVAYAVTACNRFGESAPALSASGGRVTAAEAAAGEEILLTVANAAVVGANPPEYLIIYRSRPLAAGAAAPTTWARTVRLLGFAVATQAAGPGGTLHHVQRH